MDDQLLRDILRLMMRHWVSRQGMPDGSEAHEMMARIRAVLAKERANA